MNRYPYQKPPKSWSAKLSPLWVQLLRPVRRRKQFREQRIDTIEVRGIQRLKAAQDAGQSVMVTPNHPGHADAYVLYEAADRHGSPWYFMTAWQVFHLENLFGRWALRRHGCFSIDREGTDIAAFRQSVDILVEGRHPLVIFPEGEVYHLNDRVTPFREGAAAVAFSAAKRRDAPIACIPCAIRYRYTADPTQELSELMDRLEGEIFWRPRRDLSLADRIHRFAEGALALKELEHLGCTSAGGLTERLAALSHSVLQRLEERYQLDVAELTVPERVKRLRQQVIQTLTELPDDDPRLESLGHDLDDIFLVVQLFSYPGDYLTERPTLERMAETLDKFEEDVLGLFTASIRGRRRAVACFGEPIQVDPGRRSAGAVGELTRSLEVAVQELLDKT